MFELNEKEDDNDGNTMDDANIGINNENVEDEEEDEEDEDTNREEVSFKSTR